MKMQKKGKHPMKEKKEYEEEVIQIDRVTRVVKGGRRLRFRATVAIGNRKGKVGVGVGKSTEVTGAIQKAIAQAKKTVIRVPMVENTIPHRIKVKFKSARLLLMPACPGTGIIAGGPLRKILDLAGIKDVQGKCLGNNNKVTNSLATIMALSSLKEIPWLVKKEPEKNPEKKEGKTTVKEKFIKRKDKPAKPTKKASVEPVAKEEKKPQLINTDTNVKTT
jgi:small subunit ribosomal protein S5